MGGRRLVRSRDDKMICGVAAGIAHYFGLDPTIVRLAWVVAILLPGPNLILLVAYLVLCIVLPLDVTGDGRSS
jgi:phage shock protein C